MSPIIWGCPESIEVNGQKVPCHKNHKSDMYLQSPPPEFRHYGRLTLQKETETSGLTGVVETYLEFGWKRMKIVRELVERERPA